MCLRAGRKWLGVYRGRDHRCRVRLALPCCELWRRWQPVQLLYKNQFAYFKQTQTSCPKPSTRERREMKRPKRSPAELCCERLRCCYLLMDDNLFFFLFFFLIKHTVISCQAKNTDRVVFWLLRCNYIRHQPQWLHQRKRENKQEKHGQESCFTHWVERLEEYNLGLVPIRRIFFLHSRI